MLLELEEEDKGREEVQEIERESQGEENAQMTMDGNDMKDSNILSHGACANDVKLTTKELTDCERRPCALTVEVSGSGQWCTHRAMPRNHRCCH